MRLINTTTGQFEEFVGARIPPYAILSHTWGDEEVSFKDVVYNIHFRKKGFSKIAKTCQLAAQDGWQYAWVDTCCIDKSSSAELTEAINSMYRWYERSKVCYAFLGDLEASSELQTSLEKCRWFTRGWTLQEMIASPDMRFYDKEWNFRGTKLALVRMLSQITGVTAGVLENPVGLEYISVAEKLSWAAQRETTRVEDAAYCLLGIFDINMPLLYGEEEKAFQRLQEEIIKLRADFTIFAWQRICASQNDSVSGNRYLCGVLADSPSAFLMSRSIEKRQDTYLAEFSITNTGVKINGRVFSQWDVSITRHRYVLPLNCSRTPGLLLGVKLRKVGPDQFLREDPWSLLEYTGSLIPNTFRGRYLFTKLHRHIPFGSDAEIIPRSRRHVLQVNLPANVKIHSVRPVANFDDEDQALFIAGHHEGDVESMRLRTNLTWNTGRCLAHTEFESVLFAVEWSATAQCTLIDPRTYSQEINELENIQFRRDQDSSHVVHQFVYHKIPKRSQHCISIQQTEYSAVLSFTATLTRNPFIGRNEFWRLDFWCEVHHNNGLRPTTEETWLHI